MSNHRLISITTDISDIETKIVRKVLSEYNIDPENLEKVRSVYKVKTKDNCYCLKKMKHGGSKAVKGMQLTNYLREKGFDNLATYYKTKDEKAFIRLGKNIYYLTEWINGFECNFDKYEELKRAVKLLADFHLKSKGFHSRNAKIENNFKNWPEKFLKMKRDIQIFKKLIHQKKLKTPFDMEYLKSCDRFDVFIDSSMDLLKKSNYYSVCSIAKAQKCICHDSFYYQNVLKDKDDNLYLIDLDSVVYDINVYDLAKFIRRILYKKCYSWDFNIANELIAEYSSINPLSYEDYEILLAFIIFPHKFWKLGKKRYLKRKKWNEEKYLKKLYKLKKYEEKQHEFMNKFLEYYIIEKGE